MKKLRLALLSGGTSSERAVSLNGGDMVFAALDKNRYDIIRIDPKNDLALLAAKAHEIDVAFVLLHGVNGEDGTIQGLLDLLGIPYQGTGVLGSALAMNKLASKRMYAQQGLPVPDYEVCTRDDTSRAKKAEERLGYPLVVKPVAGGSSVGMSIVSEPGQMAAALEKALEQDETVLLERCIQGMEITGAVLGNSELTALPIVEIIPGPDHSFFDYEAKYQPGAAKEVCPARLSKKLTQQAQDLAKACHRALFCKGYSRTDMMVDKQGIWILETNTIPGMVPTSLLPQAANAAGISFSALLDRLIELAIEKAP